MEILLEERSLFGSALDIYTQQTEQWSQPPQSHSHRISVGSSIVKVDDGSYMASESRSLRSETIDTCDRSKRCAVICE